MTRRNPEHGFTLLELLISLSIMAMIALMIGSALSSSARILTRSAAYSTAVEQALARRDLRELVEATLPTAFPQDDTPLFQGTSDGFRFQAVRDNGLFWPGAPTMVEVEGQDDGQIVVRQSGVSEASRAAVTSVTPLTGPDSTLAISYFGRRTAQENPDWYPTWSAEQGVPLLVKLELTDGSDVMPPLVLQPSKRYSHSEMSLSSLVPPATPSRP
jgi:prepilin-type N-terminal cleavage/methylation domain-containing protein